MVRVGHPSIENTCVLNQVFKITIENVLDLWILKLIAYVRHIIVYFKSQKACEIPIFGTFLAFWFFF